VSCVYWIRHCEHSDIFNQGYVGITENIGYRMWRHKRGRTNAHLTNAIKKYGWDNLIKEVILISSTDYCLEIEKKLRPEKEIGWNIAVGGGKPMGWAKGTKLPEWAKKRISEGKKGKLFTNEHKENLAKSKRGKNGSSSNNFKGFIRATNINTGEVVTLDGAAAMKKLGLHNSAVYKCLKGKQTLHKGYKFERVLL